jgi:hypothetical protein
MYLCLSVCLPACMSVSKTFFFLRGATPKIIFHILRNPNLWKWWQARKIWKQRVQFNDWLIIVTKIYLRSTAMHITSYMARKNWNTYSCFSYYLTFFRYQNIKLWRSLKYCHFLDEITIILGGMLGIFWGTGKILVIYSMISVVNTKQC